MKLIRGINILMLLISFYAYQPIGFVVLNPGCSNDGPYVEKYTFL